MKVLYITANPKEVSKSHSLSVGASFLETYKKVNPKDEVKVIDLFDYDVPNIDYDVMNAYEALQNGVPYEKLEAVQQQKLAKMDFNLTEFMEADKYVFVVPFWNFGLPPVVKSYIDNIAVANKTFKYTATGPIGLLEGKKALIIQSSGGVYSTSQMSQFDHGSNHLKIALSFIGVTDQETLLIEGVSVAEDGGLAIRQENINKAIEIANRF
jgi:FMN-dependent NADH-azoreductase